MACGTPVVATAVGALPEVIAAGGGGVLAARDDARGIAQQIETLLAYPERRQTLGAAGRRGVQAAYAWPQVAARTAEVYAELLQRRGRPASRSTSDSPGKRRASASSPASAP